MTIANIDPANADDLPDISWFRSVVDAAGRSTAGEPPHREPAPADIPVPAAPPAAPIDAAFLSRFVVLQAIGAAFVTALWIAGVAGRPFEGATAILCWIIVAVGGIGIFCVMLRRWRDVQWIATHVVRIGLLGTVVGLIIAFSAAREGGAADTDGVKAMIASVVDGMYVSLYATLLGIGVNLWLKINLRLLGGRDG